ncbi:hypothetical protein Y1Q_0017456 [Alligator mississippiensis]|uniref:Uncharacterized protein n=1 Tax=Alligator mississippiensis TaxID=8496 RepID=A0A151P2I7_ALLMI|nr:hypothetical protein Y1Q_0017456 [Alligator mississippiensis]
MCYICKHTSSEYRDVAELFDSQRHTLPQFLLHLWCFNYCYTCHFKPSHCWTICSHLAGSSRPIHCSVQVCVGLATVYSQFSILLRMK